MFMPLQCKALLGNLDSWHSHGLYLTCTTHPFTIPDQEHCPIAMALLVAVADKNCS